MQQGYIRLYRCMMDKGWSRDPDYVAAWIYILMRGGYKESEALLDGKIVVLQPGQFVTSRRQMSINTGIQESKIERILSCFKTEQQIEQQNKSKYRVITITNWSKYQAREQVNEQQMNSKRTADEQQMNTNKEGKKGRREEDKPKTKGQPFVLPSWVPLESWQRFDDMRTAKSKKAWTDGARTLAVQTIEKLTTNPIEAGAMLDQSTMKGWAGIFPIKDQSAGYSDNGKLNYIPSKGEDLPSWIADLRTKKQ